MSRQSLIVRLKKYIQQGVILPELAREIEGELDDMSDIDIHKLLLDDAISLHSNNELEDWISSVGSTVLTRGKFVQIDTGNGIDKVRWRKEETPRTIYKNDGWGSDEQTFRHPHTISTWISVTTKSNATPTSYVGITLGAPEGNPLYPFVPTATFCSWLALLARLDTGQWNLLTSAGGGGPSADLITVPLTSVPNLTAISTGYHLKLEWLPQSMTCRAYINGVLGVEYNDPDHLPVPYDTGGFNVAHAGAGYLVSSGTHASGRTVAQIGPYLVTHPGHRDYALGLP